MENDLKGELSKLPLSDELLKYYRHKLEALESDLANTIEQVDALRVSHEESHKLTWELDKKSRQINELQKAMSDFQVALYDERKQLLALVAENDSFKVQELKDRNKIRYLLALSGASEEEVTYFRDRLDKRLIRIPYQGHTKKTANMTAEDKKRFEDQDIVIMEDEVQSLQLKILALETQLNEQKKSYETTIEGLKKDRIKQMDMDRVRKEHDNEKMEALGEKLTKLRGLCRENTKELLRSKKVSSAHERRLIEEKAVLLQEIDVLKGHLRSEKQKNEITAENIEKKIHKKQESLVTELRSHVVKVDLELRETKDKFTELEQAYIKKVDYLKSRLDTTNANFTSLKKRRDYEIEGFTNDILMLRKQLKVLEKNILKYGPLEDKELILLSLARNTGEKAEKISTDLQGLKAKVYGVEKKVQELEI